jgi:UTP--glucose-1-phosphate uridylyltransferase
MKIRKAVITAAGSDQRTLPLQTLIDRDGQAKSALQIVIEEAVCAGAEDICVVVCPGDAAAYASAAGGHASRLHFIEQPTPRGYGHAVYCARQFIADEPFLHFVSDHLYSSRIDDRCAQQLVEVASAESCAASAVRANRESLLSYYGTVGGRRVPKTRNRYEIENVIEKPTPTEAEQRLVVPGLRAGHYLCLFGIHVLTPTIMEVLHEAVEASRGDSVQLSPALAKLASRERYLAVELQGVHHNIGVKYGLLMAQLALALDGQDRSEVLAQLVELLANRERGV